jgi:hypothetical protein
MNSAPAHHTVKRPEVGVPFQAGIAAAIEPLPQNNERQTTTRLIKSFESFRRWLILHKSQETRRLQQHRFALAP